jgi:hypothetical protein
MCFEADCWLLYLFSTLGLLVVVVRAAREGRQVLQIAQKNKISGVVTKKTESASGIGGSR